MDSLFGALPLCLILLLALHLGAVAAGDARAAAGTSAGVVSAFQGLDTGVAAAGGASSMDAKSGPAMSVNDLPLTPDHSTSAKVIPGAPTLAQGNTLVPLPKRPATRRALAHTGSCKCLASVQSLIFSTKHSYISGYTQGLCPFCAAGQSYNPAWGDYCQDCGACLSRYGSSGVCYSDVHAVESVRLFSGSYQWWYDDVNCPSNVVPSEAGTLTPVGTVGTGSNTFTCVNAHPTSGSDGGFMFNSYDNCNTVIWDNSATCAYPGEADYAYVKPTPFYTTPTRATC